jgi:hypothetical protein
MEKVFKAGLLPATTQNVARCLLQAAQGLIEFTDEGDGRSNIESSGRPLELRLEMDLGLILQSATDNIVEDTMERGVIMDFNGRRSADDMVLKVAA